MTGSRPYLSLQTELHAGAKNESQQSQTLQENYHTETQLFIKTLTSDLIRWTCQRTRRDVAFYHNINWN